MINPHKNVKEKSLKEQRGTSKMLQRARPSALIGHKDYLIWEFLDSLMVWYKCGYDQRGMIACDARKLSMLLTSPLMILSTLVRCETGFPPL